MKRPWLLLLPLLGTPALCCGGCRTEVDPSPDGVRIFQSYEKIPIAIQEPESGSGYDLVPLVRLADVGLQAVGVIVDRPRKGFFDNIYHEPTLEYGHAPLPNEIGHQVRLPFDRLIQEYVILVRRKGPMATRWRVFKVPAANIKLDKKVTMPALDDLPSLTTHGREVYDFVREHQILRVEEWE